MIRPPWGRALAARIPALLVCALVAGVVAPAQVWAGIEDCTVQGTSPRGTTINLFDYWLDAQSARDDVNPADYLNAGINAGEVLKFGKNMGTAQNTSEASLTTETVNYWTRSARPRTGIVDNVLAPDGYPRLNSARLGGGSLAYLFDREAHNGKAAYSGVKGLLQVDRQGYYYYNSQENFAQFNVATGMFTLFDAWGVKAGGASPNGQFFPFNTGSQVFGTAQQDGREVLQQKNVYSTSPGIKHYFGMTMSTRFVQQNGGHTNEERQTPVTYNFSGDDDVWIFIDGVLVGDLGGIHDKTSVSIDFSTGEVVVYWDKNNDNEFDAGDEAYSTSTLRDCFERAGVAASFSDGTFADDTYHTLDFFYLERGNTDSNMSLRYNLVSIPESDVVKVDQASEPIAGVEFVLYPTGENYEVAEDATPAYTGHTDNSGTMTVLDGQRGFPVALSELEQRSAHWVLRETSAPAGYRHAGDIPLYFDPAITSNTLLFSADPWGTGAYAQPKLTSTTTAQGVYSVDGERLSTDSGELPEGAWMFAVVMQKGSDGAWHAVMGNALDGWRMSASEGMEGVVEAARSGDADRFALNSNGMYQTEVTNMPGNIKAYEWIVQNNPGVGAPSSIRYTVQYFYTTAADAADVSADNTVRVRSGADDFERQFATRLYVANIENRLMVQKLDEKGEPLEGAEFSLYRADDVTVTDGKAAVSEGAQPVAAAVTADLEITSANGGGSLTLKGALAFGRIVGSPLDEGTYCLLESQAPQGYVVNETPVKVVVDETGVYADAGSADDGVAVARGVGRVVGSMQQFTVDDDVDATLHDIKAALVTAPSYEGEQSTWSKPDWRQTSGPDATAMHLQYNDPGDNLPGAVFDYAPVGEGPVGLETEVGWSKLVVEQDLDRGDGASSPKQDLGDRDIARLYAGSVIVRVSDEPVASEGPGEPENPGGAGGSENPDNPDNPDEPGAPEGPGGSDNPSEPGGTDKPDDPDGPDDSDGAGDPGDSGETGEPDNPENPDSPDHGEKPDTPDEGGSSGDQSGGPGDSDKPEDPGQPGGSGDQNNDGAASDGGAGEAPSEQGDEGSQESQGSQDRAPGSSLPPTADYAPMVVIGTTLMALGSTALGVLLRRRKR